jgi:hypothetical protein
MQSEEPITVFVSVCAVLYPNMPSGTSCVGRIGMWHKITVLSVQR